MKKFKSVDMHFTDSKVKFNMPLTKIDEERRLVSGFATLDNEDTSSDVITADASREAFTRFRGNIREMHQPIAAGKLVDFSTKSYFDPTSGAEYTGVYVTAYVSKGAQGTWEKVLDGTLSGFSVGGGIEESHTDVSKATGNAVRVITKYELDELSLVDNPCNQLANVFSIEKVAGETKATGISTDVTIENIFYCDTDEIAKCSAEDKEVCDLCDTEMKNIAWVESSDNKAEKVKKAVGDYKNGGETVGTKTEKVETQTPENEGVGQAEVDATEEAVVTDEAEETSSDDEENVVDNEEVVTEESDLEKVLSEIRSSLGDVTKTTSAEIGRVEKAFQTAQEDIVKKFNDLASSYEDVNKRIEDVNKSIAAVEERVDTVAKGVAVKKAAELENSGDELEKNKRGIWNGSIFFDADRV